MNRDELIEKFSTFTKLSALIERNRVKRAKKALLKSIGTFAVAVILSAALSFSWIGWSITLTAALAISFLLFGRQGLFKREPVVGTVETIQHEYYTGQEKGTGGFSQVHTYTAIRRQHNLLLTLRSPCDAQSYPKVICPSLYERVLSVGDTVLYHPDLTYPATLSNITTCICMNCGTMQDANASVCHTCGVELCNRKTML